VGGSREHGNEPVVSMKCGEFLSQLNDYQRLMQLVNPGYHYTEVFLAIFIFWM